MDIILVNKETRTEECAYGYGENGLDDVVEGLKHIITEFGLKNIRGDYEIVIKL